MNGKLAKLRLGKGFGFVTGADGQDYFMHRSAVREGSTFEQLREGQRVEFDAGQGEKGPRAENLRVV